MWSHKLHRVLNLLPQIRKLILFLNALRCLLKHPRIIYRLLKFTFALERVQEIQLGLMLPHLLIILGILQLCHTFALCFYSAELWPRQPTEITSLPGIARSPPLLSQAVSCPHPDLAAQWQSQRHTLQMLTLSCSFSSFFPPAIWCLVFDCLSRSSAPGLSHCQGSKSPSAQIGWISRYRQRGAQMSRGIISAPERDRTRSEGEESASWLKAMTGFHHVL